MIEIIIVKNPFEPHFKAIRREEFVAGKTVKEYYPDADIFVVNGELIKQPEKRKIIKDNTQIIVTQHIGGGGGLGKILGYVATIALIAYTGNIAAGGWAVGNVGFFAAGHLGAILASGAVMYLGGRLINSVFPQKSAAATINNSDTTQTYGWDIPTPTAAEGNVMGITFGECIPQAQVLTQHVETVNSQQYLNLLLCGGIGPVDEIKNIRIGNNDIGNYTDVQIETKLGTNDQDSISFFNNNPIDQSVSLELGSSPLIQTTNSEKAVSLEVTMEWSGGLFKINDDGSYTSTTVTIALMYRQKGTTAWNSWNASWSITAAQSSLVAQSIRIDGLPEAQYEIRAEMISRDTSSRASTITRWALLTSYENGKYCRQGKVLVALRILATNQLSGGVPSVNWRQVRNNVWVFNPDSGVYEQRSAKNPIWAAYDILHQCYYLKNINTGSYEYVVEGIDKSRLIKYWDQWVDAAAYADEMILNNDGEQEKRFEFDAFFDTSEKRITQAQKAATVGHATILSHGNDIGIVVDKPGTVCQIFGEGRTTVSSVKGSFTSLDERAKEINVTYNDIDNDFKNTQFLTRSQTWNDSDQDNTTDLTLFGVARRSQAWREAIRSLATNERQLQDIEFSADINAMVSEFGDIIGFNHAVSQIGIASGRIVAVSDNTIQLDKEITLSSALLYEIIIQRYDDTIVKKSIVSQDATTNLLEIQVPFSSDEKPQQYDVYCLGETEKAVKPFRVINISRDGDQLCNIKAVEYDEAVYSDSLDYSKYPVIDYTPPNSQPEVDSLSAAEETYMQRDGTTISNINVSWSLQRGQSVDEFVVGLSENGVSYQTAKTTNDMKCIIENVKTYITYYVHVYTVKDGIVSKGQTVSVYITGKDAPPQDISKLYIIQSGEYLTASIIENDDPDINYYELRTGVTWTTSTIVGTFTGNSYKFEALNEGTQTFWIKAVDNSGNYSLNATKATVNVINLPTKNIIFQRTENLADWNITNMYMDQFGALNAFSDSVPIGSLEFFSDIFKQLSFSKICTAYVPIIDLGPNIVDTACFWIDQWGVLYVKSNETIETLAKFGDMFGNGPWTPIDVKYLASTFMSIKLKSNAGDDIVITQDYRTSVDGKAWSDWISSTHRQFYGRYIQIRLAGQSLSGLNQLKISGAETDIDVPDTEEIIENIEVPAAIKHISFKQKFFTVPSSVALFTSDLNSKQATWRMSNLDADGFDLEILDDSGNNMAGMLIRADIRGY
ncbi:TipJ family phage tail tip protein [Pectinatus haikarae]|uniref:Phage tail protein n=1 Tax=Pectinatus haikarae TaxID=349096 RepID=A0ABT9Y8C5_9FIRM|nr:phage tail protein [Pectinatus haikarae]MDQ0204062.1 putative phage tail protein [Pectinatus haikarae]